MEYWLSVLYISLEFYAYTLGMEAFLPRRWKKSKHWLFFSAWIVVMYAFSYLFPFAPGNWHFIRSFLTILFGGIILYSSRNPIYHLTLTLIDYLILYFCTFIASFIASQILEITIYAVSETYLPSILSALLSRILCIFLMFTLKRFCNPVHNQSARLSYLVIATLFPLTSFFVLLTFLSILRSSSIRPLFPRQEQPRNCHSRKCVSEGCSKICTRRIKTVGQNFEKRLSQMVRFWPLFEEDSHT